MRGAARVGAGAEACGLAHVNTVKVFIEVPEHLGDFSTNLI